MALFLRGMEGPERVALTEAMRDSGTVIGWDLDRPVLDKHSTGGVGDKVSLMLAPIVAACGGAVPMISGRGLGHTGGTLDKLDSVPGYDTTPDVETLKRVVAEAGCAIVGQTGDLAPADRRLYAIRDATGTVESIPLIVASILSKKLAAGLDALVMDVKFGSGAFMAEREAAEELARALVEVAGGAGLPTVALLTDMNEVLGESAGNALEVREAIDFLTGRWESRLHEVTLRLAASLLVQGGLAPDEETAGADAQRALASGAAAETFARMIAALGGPADLLERPDEHLASAPVQRAVDAPEGDRDRDGLPRGRPGHHGPRRQPRARDRHDRPVRRPHLDRAGGHAGRPRPPARDRPRARRGRRGRRGGGAAGRGHGRRRRARRAAGRRGADRVIPKAELHVHLEGTAPPGLVRRLAARNGLKIPEGVFADEDTFRWVDFLDFLHTYDLAASVIRTAEDYRDVTYEYLSSCAAEGAIYVELIASPDHADAVGLTDAEHFGGIAAGIDDARRDHGIEARILATAIRNHGVEAAEALARRLDADRHPYVVGFQLAGDEAGYPPEPFARAYEIAAELGPRLQRPRRRARGRGVGAGSARRCPSRGSPTASARSRTRRWWPRSPSAGSCSRSARPATSRPASSPATRTIRSVRFVKRGFASRWALTIRPTSDVVSAQSTPWRASAWAWTRWS